MIFVYLRRVLVGLRFFVGGLQRIRMARLTGHVLGGGSPSVTRNYEAVVRFLNNRAMHATLGSFFDGIPQQFNRNLEFVEIGHAAILQDIPQKRRGPFLLCFAGGNA